MSHTEAQAKLLWCPMAQQQRVLAIVPGRIEGHSEIREVHSGVAPSCLASGCAVWVWDANRELPGLLAAKDYVEAHPELIEKHGGKIRAIAAWHEANRKPGSVATGHCGLIQRG